MSEYVFKLPDLGEGTVEAEIVEWHVKPGDTVQEEDVICDVMTDKATVEVPAPVSGTVKSCTGEPGDVVAVGSALIVFETDAAVAAAAAKAEAAAPAAAAQPEPDTDTDTDTDTGPVSAPQSAPDPQPPAKPSPQPRADARPTATAQPTRAQSGTPDPRPGDPGYLDPERPILTSPAIRRHAREAGVDLARVPGSGPKGRILREDLDAFLASGGAHGRGTPAAAPPLPSGAAPDEVTSSKVIGIRRVIAERMSQSKREIPHFAYVEEVDVSELEALRKHLNAEHPDRGRLTVLPFIGIALIRALREFPQCNATYDAATGLLHTHRRVHLGLATQTPDGLKVPVVRGADGLGLWDLATEIARVAEAARNNSAKREELTGSTITLTSLGKLGGIATTPVINYPEVGILGPNKAVERPVVMDGQVVVRTIMNLSSSFDHRFVDGYDAAAMVQRIKGMLEHPATLFMP